MTRASALLLAALMAAPASLVAQSVNEPGSGVAFPTELNAADGSRHALLGTGLRTRTVLNVKVYAFGIYTDATLARANLSAWAGRDAAALANDAALYDRLLRMDLPMSLRLVMTRNVSGEQMAEAFDGALRPRVQASDARGGTSGGLEALDTFRGFFSVDRLTQGAELVFTCTPNGTLHTRVNTEAKPAIESRALCGALFDVYLGRTPISPSGKRSAVARLPEVLR